MWSRLTSTIHQAVATTANFLCPQHCVLCSAQELAEDNSGCRVCVHCRNAIAPKIENSCGRCGAAVGPHVSTADGCVHCRRVPIRFDSVVCLGMYNEPMRNAVLSAKWSWSSVAIESLGILLERRQRDRLASFQPDLIIPIPQNLKARMTRHFNPAEMIALVLSRALEIPVDLHILRRKRTTRPQKRVSVMERFRNQRNSFRIRDTHLVKGKRILLVDDVLTTGATCSEAARVLKAHGALACHVAAIARVLQNL